MNSPTCEFFQDFFKHISEDHESFERAQTDFYGEIKYWLDALPRKRREELCVPFQNVKLQASESRGLLDYLVEKVPSGLPLIFQQTLLVLENLLGIQDTAELKSVMRKHLNSRGMPFWDDIPSANGIFPRMVGRGTEEDIRGVRVTIVPLTLDHSDAREGNILNTNFYPDDQMKEAMNQARLACISLLENQGWKNYLSMSNLYVTIDEGGMQKFSGNSIGLALAVSIMASLARVKETPNPQSQDLELDALPPWIHQLGPALKDCSFSASVSSYGRLGPVGALRQKLVSIKRSPIKKSCFSLEDSPNIQLNWVAVAPADRIKVRLERETGWLRTQSGKEFFVASELRPVLEYVATATIICPNCNKAALADSIYCQYCGTKIAVEPLIEKAGFWIRLGAYLIDAAALNVGAFAIGLFLGFFLALTSGPSTSVVSATTILGFILQIGLTVFYFTFCTGKWGQTLGKKVAGIKVIGEDNAPVGYSKAFLRWVGYIVSGVTLGLGFLWILWDKNKQGFHDKIAHTYVISIEEEKVKKARASLGLGVSGMIMWLIPAMGFPTAIMALVFGIQGLSSLKKDLAIAGIVLSIFGLAATIIYASIASYMGVMGRF